MPLQHAADLFFKFGITDLPGWSVPAPSTGGVASDLGVSGSAAETGDREDEGVGLTWSPTSPTQTLVDPTVSCTPPGPWETPASPPIALQEAVPKWTMDTTGHKAMMRQPAPFIGMSSLRTHPGDSYGQYTTLNFTSSHAHKLPSPKLLNYQCYRMAIVRQFIVGLRGEFLVH